MVLPTFIAQPSFRLSSKPKLLNSSISLPILSLHTLSPHPIPHSFLTSTPFFSPPPAPTPSKPLIVWFRSDLRLHDHPALTQALDQSPSSVIPLFIFDPRNFGKTAFGFEKTGRYRAKFLIESVTTLRESLRNRGSDLVVRIGHPEQILPRLARHLGAGAVLCHKELSLDDNKLEASLQSALHRAAIHFHPLWTNTLYHIEDLPFPIHHLPDVYTVYRERVQTNSKIRHPLPAPKTIPPLPRMDSGHIPSLTQLGLTEPSPQSSAIHDYVGGETEALRKLSAYVKEASTTSRLGYTSADHLGADFSCRISPWLALGCVSPRQIYADLAVAAPRVNQTTTYFELVWRDFFRYITAKYNQAKLINSKTAPAFAIAT